MSSSNLAEQRMDQLERAVVFRTARGSFFLMAVVATLTFVAGIVAGTFGYIKMPITRPSPPPPIPEVAPPPPVTYQQVEAWLAADEARRKAAAAIVPPPAPVYGEPDDPSQPTATRDPILTELERLDGALRALFPNPPYVWDDVYEEYCANETAYGCMHTARRLKTEGLSRALREVLKRLSRADKVETLQLLVSVLGQAPVERRGALLGPIIAVNDEMMAGYRHQVAEREGEVDRQRSQFSDRIRAYLGKVAKQQQAKAAQRRYGLYGIVAGLALLILVSVFLVHFAMERHLRLMREIIDLQRRVAPPAATAEPPSPESFVRASTNLAPSAVEVDRG